MASNNISIGGSEPKKISMKVLMDSEESRQVISKVSDLVTHCEDDVRIVITTPGGKAHYFDSQPGEIALDVIMSGRSIGLPGEDGWVDFSEMMKPFSEVECKVEIAEAKKAMIQEHLNAMIDPNWQKSLDDMSGEGLKPSTHEKLKGVLHESDAGSSAPVLHIGSSVNFCAGEASSSSDPDSFDPMQFLNLDHCDSEPESVAENLQSQLDG